MSLTLAQDASACSLCRRFTPYDCSEAERRNLILRVNILSKKSSKYRRNFVDINIFNAIIFVRSLTIWWRYGKNYKL